jgi:hypothetical protein
MLRPIPRIVQRPGYPEGYPGPFQTAGIFDPAVPSLVAPA